jgi:hypothetical protein
MKIVFCAVAAVVILGMAYSLGPDVARYMKIKSM